MSKRFLFLSMLLAAVLGGIVAVLATSVFSPQMKTLPDGASLKERQKFYMSRLQSDTSLISVPGGINFVYSANAVRPSVVHIKTSYGRGNRNMDEQERSWFDQFHGPDLFDGPMPRGEASGSGVIYREDGYIITNNHVIKDAEKVIVVLEDKRSFEAKVIGSDPNTDLAVIKVEEGGLPAIKFGNSDNLQIGEWVLAVGNPFDLTSTVTAGIVSAKARNINILRSRSNMQIESFIQTDAAVNPGNSGGALVNLRGELVGINTAIASNTGSYTGYSFAVPSSIVNKVAEDLMKYGEVQRAMLGVVIRDIDADFAKDKGLPSIKGVYVDGVNQGSAAADAKLKQGDIIYQINGVDVNSSSELIEHVARNRPGDQITITYMRDGSLETASVKLKNIAGSTRIIKKEEQAQVRVQELGAVLTGISAREKEELGISEGVKVLELDSRGVLANANVEEGFIITRIDKKPVRTPADVQKMIRAIKGGVMIEGTYPDGRKAYYAFGLS